MFFYIRLLIIKTNVKNVLDVQWSRMKFYSEYYEGRMFVDITSTFDGNDKLYDV